MPQTRVTRSFTFEASHVLPWHPGKCSGLHGHGYRLDVTVAGTPDENGVVIDFDDLAEIVQKHVIATLDHAHLNDVIESPTAERIAEHVWDVLSGVGLALHTIRVSETGDCWAEVSDV